MAKEKIYQLTLLYKSNLVVLVSLTLGWRHVVAFGLVCCFCCQSLLLRVLRLPQVLLWHCQCQKDLKKSMLQFDACSYSRSYWYFCNWTTCREGCSADTTNAWIEDGRQKGGQPHLFQASCCIQRKPSPTLSFTLWELIGSWSRATPQSPGTEGHGLVPMRKTRSYVPRAVCVRRPGQRSSFAPAFFVWGYLLQWKSARLLKSLWKVQPRNRFTSNSCNIWYEQPPTTCNDDFSVKSGREFQECAKTCKNDRPPSKAITISHHFWYVQRCYCHCGENQQRR